MSNPLPVKVDTRLVPSPGVTSDASQIPGRVAPQPPNSCRNPEQSQSKPKVPDQSSKEKRENDGGGGWKVQGMLDIKASLLNVKGRLSHINEEFYGETPPSKVKAKKGTANWSRYQDGDVPTMVNSDVREVQLNDQGIPERKYGPRPNTNKNNMGENVSAVSEQVEEEVVVTRTRRPKKKKHKARRVGRLVRLQRHYARSHYVAREPRPDESDPFRDSIITRLEYLGATRDLIGGNYNRETSMCRERSDSKQKDSPSLGYDFRQLDDFGQLTLVTADGFYGISDPITTKTHKDFRPLKLPVIDVNSTFGEFGRDTMNGAGSLHVSSPPLPKVNGSFSAVKQYLEKLFERKNQRSMTDDRHRQCGELTDSAPMFLRHDGDRALSFLLSPQTNRPSSARSTISLVKHINDPGIDVHRVCEEAADDGRFLHVSSIKPMSTTLKITPPSDQNNDVLIFSEIKWPTKLPSHAFAQSQKLNLANCSEPPPSTPESEYTGAEQDDVMSVAIHQQLFRKSDQSSTRQISNRGLDLYHPRNTNSRPENYQDLRLDVVHRPLRERSHVN